MTDTILSSDIKQLIAECGNEAMKKILDSHLPEKLSELAKALAIYYQCCYCGIGTIDGDYAEDRACWPQVQKTADIHPPKTGISVHFF